MPKTNILKAPLVTITGAYDVGADTVNAHPVAIDVEFSDLCEKFSLDRELTKQLETCISNIRSKLNHGSQ